MASVWRLRRPRLHLSRAWQPSRPAELFRTAYAARVGSVRLQSGGIVGGMGVPGGAPNTVPDPTDPEDGGGDGKDSKKEHKPPPTWFKMLESALTTLASVAVLGLVGYGYTKYYKRLVITKIEGAFEPGDPVLELAAQSRKYGDLLSTSNWVPRDEQELIDAIVDGTTQGKYYLLIGEKGTGKSSMLIDAMRKVNGDGVSMFEAHADAEIVRIRLGKALDFEFHEDNIGSLFSIRGPRDASALLDMERAFNKLEKVALSRRKRTGKPLVLIINQMHFLRDDEDGKDMLELIQQRAEQWAASNLCTMVFNSDDYWVYERLKLEGARMEVIPVHDLNKPQAMAALRAARLESNHPEPSTEDLARVYDQVGGRIAYLKRVAQHSDMFEACEEICTREKTWFLSKCGILGAEMDDDVMDQQKFASAAMVLARALVQREKELADVYHPEHGYKLPEIPLHEAREIMTRADFIQQYDQINVFTIDSRAMVRADSVPMQKAFQEICAKDGFDEFLEATLDRISDIESLGRTREITLKDLWKKGSKYAITVSDSKGRMEKKLAFEAQPAAGDDDDDDD